jgi:hypothetical protein
MIGFETPNNSWPELIPQITQSLGSNDTNSVLAGLTVLLEIIKNWQYFDALLL